MSGKNKPGAGRPPAETSEDTFAGRVGGLIRRRRVKLKLTLNEVARRSGGSLTVSMLSSYEIGRSEPTLSNYVALCMALGVGPEDFLPRPLRRQLAAGRDA